MDTDWTPLSVHHHMIGIELGAAMAASSEFPLCNMIYIYIIHNQAPDNIIDLTIIGIQFQFHYNQAPNCVYTLQCNSEYSSHPYIKLKPLLTRRGHDSFSTSSSPCNLPVHTFLPSHPKAPIVHCLHYNTMSCPCTSLPQVIGTCQNQYHYYY